MPSNIIPSDSPSLFDQLSVLDSQAIIRPNNPPPGIAAYLFDIPLEERVRVESSITDHFIESNTAVADQMAIRPETFMVRGLVAEIVAYNPNPQAVVTPPNALPLNGPMVPIFSPAQAQAMGSNAVLVSHRKKALPSSVYAYYLDKSPQKPNLTRQSNAFNYFYQYQRGRMQASIETPWGIFNSMALLTFEAEQDETTRGQTIFTLTFKKIRIAGSPQVNVGQLAGRNALQAAPVVNNGVAGLVMPNGAQANAYFDQFTSGTNQGAA